MVVECTLGQKILFNCLLQIVFDLIASLCGVGVCVHACTQIKTLLYKNGQRIPRSALQRAESGAPGVPPVVAGAGQVCVCLFMRMCATATSTAPLLAVHMQATQAPS